MRLVLDANRLFAALIRDSIARKILFHPSLEFIAPIFENIIIVPSEEIKPCYKRAMEIMKNIDPDDVVFLALSFCSPNDGIWSEDAHFEKQDAARVWKSTELMEILGMKKI